MYKKIVKFICAVLVLFHSPIAYAKKIYVVKNGDFISEVLNRHNLKPIYGASGFLEKTLQLNPRLRKQNGNKIYPGQKIILPFETDQILTSNPPNVITDQPVSAEVTPQTVQIKNTSEEEFPISSVRVGLSADYFRFDTQDRSTLGEAQILSDPNLGIQAAWIIHWTPQSEFYFQAGYQKYSIQNPNISIDYINQKGSLTQLGIGSGYLFNDRLSARFGIDLKQEIFIHSPAVNLIQFDTVMITQPYLFGRYALLNKGRFSLGLDAEYRFLISNSNDIYQIDSGSGYLGGIFIKELFRDKKFSGMEARLSYAQKNQNTNLETQKEKTLNLQFNFEWEL